MEIYVVSGLYIDEQYYPTIIVPRVFKDYEDAKKFLKSEYKAAKKYLTTPHVDCEKQIEKGYLHLCFENKTEVEWRINKYNASDIEWKIDERNVDD